MSLPSTPRVVLFLSFRSLGALYVKPTPSRYWTIPFSLVRIRVAMCRECIYKYVLIFSSDLGSRER